MAGAQINPATMSWPEKPTDLTFEISKIADRLATLIRGTNKFDVMEIFNLCIHLARDIDYAITNNEVPSKAPDLPLLLKQICKLKNDPMLQAGIMVLMISVKDACKRRWFPDKECLELHSLAKEMGSSFSSARNINTEACTSHSTISTIMSRFYPRMKMGEILGFLEVKPGYGAFLLDFLFSKDAKSSPEEEVRLFVAQKDNIETSSCIITPLNVNFLLNGNGVDQRTNVVMETGPQNPTILTDKLEYGTNLLQAIGQFDGIELNSGPFCTTPDNWNYIILVAFMSVFSIPDVPAQNYIRPTVPSLDSDSEIIEGPSRVSLNCPISVTRIKTPVKGRICKHLQCFDFENFVDINSRRPSWRCPCCNHSVCFLDIRVDQNMLKVLKEVGETVTDITISANGSWKAIMETDKPTGKSNHKDLISKVGGPTEKQDINSSNSSSDIMDLTLGDDPMDISNYIETEDRKPSVNPNPQNQPNPTVNNLIDIVPNNPRIEHDFWTGIYMSTLRTSSNSDSQIIGGVSESTPANNMMPSPVLTDAVSPSVPDSFQSPRLNSSVLIQQQLQQLNSSTNEYGGQVPEVNRTPIAVQALATPTQAPLPPQQISRAVQALATPTQAPPPPQQISRAVQALATPTQTPPPPQQISRAVQALATPTQAPPPPQQISRAGLNGSFQDGSDTNLPSSGVGFNRGSCNSGAYQFSRPQSLHTIPVSQINSSALHQISGSQHDGSAANSLPGGNGLNRRSSKGGAYQFSRPHSLHTRQVSQMKSTALEQITGSQGRGYQKQQQEPFVSTRPPTQPIIRSVRGSTQIPNRATSSFSTEPTRAQPLHLRTPSPGLIRSPPAHMQQTQIRAQSIISPNTQHNLMMTSPNQRPTIPAAQRQAPYVPVSVQSKRTPSPLGTKPVQQQPITRPDGSSAVTADQNWRPTGRMRGSLSGQAYSEAYNQFISIPTQSGQPSRPSVPPGMGTQLHVLPTNKSVHGSLPQVGNISTTKQDDVAGLPGFMVEGSSGMK